MRALLGLDTDVPIDVNHRRTLYSAFLMGVIGPAVFIVQPGVVGALVELLGFSPQQANYIAFAEIGGIAAATIMLGMTAHRVHWRRLVAWSLLVVAAGNFASMLVQGYAQWLGIRFIVGLGSGVLVSLGYATVGLSAHPDRNFAWSNLWVLVYGGVALMAMPAVLDFGGMNALLALFGLFALTGLPFARFMPSSGHAHAPAATAARRLSAPLRLVALLAMFCYFLSIGVVWPNLELLATAGGIERSTATTTLGLSQWLGVAGSYHVVLMSGRGGRAKPFVLGVLVAIAALALLLGALTTAVFALAVCAYNYVWNFTQPVLIGAQASFDRTGTQVVRGSAMQMLGLALGPFLAASLIAGDDYSKVLGAGVVFFVLAIVAILGPMRVEARLPKD